MDAKFKAIQEKQLKLAEEIWTTERKVRILKENYEKLVGYLCTKHYLHDSVFYIQNCGALGFRAIRFYNDTPRLKMGTFQQGMAEAYAEAICFM